MAVPLTSDTRLADHRGGYVIATCTVCGHRRDFSVEELALRIGWQIKVCTVIRRFRCNPCGARRALVEFGYDSKPRRWAKNLS